MLGAAAADAVVRFQVAARARAEVVVAQERLEKHDADRRQHDVPEQEEVIPQRVEDRRLLLGVAGLDVHVDEVADDEHREDDRAEDHEVELRLEVEHRARRAREEAQVKVENLHERIEAQQRPRQEAREERREDREDLQRRERDLDLEAHHVPDVLADRGDVLVVREEDQEEGEQQHQAEAERERRVAALVALDGEGEVRRRALRAQRRRVPLAAQRVARAVAAHAPGRLAVAHRERDIVDAVEVGLDLHLLPARALGTDRARRATGARVRVRIAERAALADLALADDGAGRERLVRARIARRAPAVGHAVVLPLRARRHRRIARVRAAVVARHVDRAARTRAVAVAAPRGPRAVAAAHAVAVRPRRCRVDEAVRRGRGRVHRRHVRAVRVVLQQQRASGVLAVVVEGEVAVKGGEGLVRDDGRERCAVGRARALTKRERSESNDPLTRPRAGARARRQRAAAAPARTSIASTMTLSAAAALAAW